MVSTMNEPSQPDNGRDVAPKSLSDAIIERALAKLGAWQFAVDPAPAPRQQCEAQRAHKRRGKSPSRGEGRSL
jgi:hypothetical protein